MSCAPRGSLLFAAEEENVQLLDFCLSQCHTCSRKLWPWVPRAVESGFRGRSLCPFPSSGPCSNIGSQRCSPGSLGCSAALSHSRRSIPVTQHSPFCHLAGGPRQPCCVITLGSSRTPSFSLRVHPADQTRNLDSDTRDGGRHGTANHQPCDSI